MRRVAFLVAIVSVAGVSLVAGPGRASLYSPDGSYVVPFDDGKPNPLPFGEFKRRLAVLTNAMVEPKLGEPPNTDRKQLLDRIAKQPDPANPAAKRLSDNDATALAADLLRVGQFDKALNLLGPRTAARRPDYFVFSTLAHIHAARGEWTDALRYLTEGQLDTKMPAEVKGLAKGQREWWARLDSDYLPHLFHLRKQQTEARRGLSNAELDKLNETEDVFPLFPLPDEKGKPRPPVRFVNDAGTYEPGTLAATEKAKLPPDAIAVVQQLLLWFPGEVRLYWLLAELYAAEGELDSANTIFDECVGPRAHGNLKVLMDHRNAVRAAIEARPKPPGPPAPPISMTTIFIYFGVVAAVALLALVRVLLKRKSRGATA